MLEHRPCSFGPTDGTNGRNLKRRCGSTGWSSSPPRPGPPAHRKVEEQKKKKKKKKKTQSSQARVVGSCSSPT